MLQRLAIAIAVTCAACRAQDSDRVQPHMRAMSDAVMAMQKALAAEDRTALATPLAILATHRDQLADLLAPEPEARAGRWLGEFAGAIDDLRDPDATAATTTADFARLRRACTSCHLERRTDNDERGLFPNEHNAVFGRLAVTQQDGTPAERHDGAVVFLEAPGLTSPPLARHPAISQRGRRFLPSVLAVTAGTTVRFPNDDVVFHNVFSLSRSNPFDLGTYGKGVANERVLTNPGLVSVHCNIHPDMAAHVLVLQNGFAAVTDDTGFWVIPDVPDGDYQLRVWQTLSEPIVQTINLRGDRATEVVLRVTETRPRAPHANKFGRPYQAKY